MFGRDPFDDPFGTRRQMRQMEDMMDGMMGNPFGMDSFFNMGRPPIQQHQMMLEDGQNRRRGNGRSHLNNQMANPFGFGMGLFGNMMNQMQHMQHDAVNSPHSQVFAQSTVISYDGTGRPKVVQNTVRKTGDVKETKRTIRDGDREEVMVGHAIGDREHVVAKKKDKDGRVRKSQKFVNLDDSEADAFTQEFQTRAQQNLNGFFNGRPEVPRHQAIEDVHRSSHSRPATTTNTDRVRSSVTTTSRPIIEIPDDDDSDVEILSDNTGRNRQRGKYSNNGPVISEITDEDASSSKRRKGMFGRFFADD